jgi:hypothetical protein
MVPQSDRMGFWDDSFPPWNGTQPFRGQPKISSATDLGVRDGVNIDPAP